MQATKLIFCWLFQFTPLREGRPRSPAATGSTDRISIHAPTRGATSFAFVYRSATLEFQFTPLREGRPATPSRTAPGILLFQFTPLREGRPWLGLPSVPFLHNHVISIHAPTRGATPPFSIKWEPEKLKNISIHAPTRGATSTSGLRYPAGLLFQFTPLREGRLGLSKQILEDLCISIHAPTRGATI